jgi:hypothetical protein
MAGWSTWALWGLTSSQQGYDAIAKQSTRFLGTGAGIATCGTDRSQRLTNLGVGAGSVVLLEGSPASARFDFSHPRTILFRVTADNNDTGNLFRHGSASPTRLMFSAANTIQCMVNNAVALSYTVTGLGAGAEELVIAWVSEANPDTTGASDAVLSWLYIWNTADGTFDKTRFTHATSTTKTQTAFFGAGDNAGTAVFSGTITGIQFENRLMSATEIAHDWVSALSSPGTSVQNDDQGLPISSSIGFAAQSAFHGPAAAWACDATRRMKRRLFSPLWNENMRIETEFTQGELDSATDPWIRGAPSANGWRMHLTFLRSYPVPPGATHLWVRVQIRTYVSSADAVPLGCLFYSMNKNPSDEGGEALVPYSVQEKVTRDDAATEGSYVIKAKVPISKDADGFTWLALAFNIDPDDESTNDNRERVRVRSVHAVPVTVDEQGGLGFGDGGMGS